MTLWAQIEATPLGAWYFAMGFGAMLGFTIGWVAHAYL
jgi:hypothetical protein